MVCASLGTFCGFPGAALLAQSAPVPPGASHSLVSILAGSTFASAPSGLVIGSFETPVRAEVLERRDGWAHIRVDAWISDGFLADTTAVAGLTAAEIRAAPDKYVGRTVEWTLQVLAIQRADELRPELPEGQPYVLASGPLPESGFVYLAIPTTEVDSFRALPPLAKIKVRAIVRAGRSRFLPTPVLTFVRRLN